MPENYESQFHLLLEDIHPVSPHAAEKLMQIEAALGARAAYYAAFVIVCLEARGKQTNYRLISSLTPDELSNFTFFEYTKESPQAISAFSEVLSSYKVDSQRRLSLDQNQNASAAV
jgi:hypothetical protein